MSETESLVLGPEIRLAILKRLKVGTEYADLGAELYPTLTRRETDEIMKEAGSLVEVLQVEAECDREYAENMRAALAAKDAEIALLRAGLDAIVDRADNGDLGTSKVQDMRRIAAGLRGASL